MKLERTKYNGVYLYRGARGDVYYGSFWYSKKKQSIRVKLGGKKDGITSAKKAYAKLEEIRTAANERWDVHYKNDDGETVVKSHSITLDDLAKRYFEEREKKIRREFRRIFGGQVSNQIFELNVSKKLRAVRTERRRYEKFVQSHKLSKMRVSKIQRVNVLEWLEYLDSFVDSGQISNKTFLNIVNLVKTIWNRSVNTGYITLQNPFATVEIKNKNTRPIVRERYLSEEELDRFEETLKKDAEDSPTRLNAYIAFMIGRYTGARANTVLNVRVSDIDFVHKQIKLFNFKANKFYVIPLADRLGSFLKKLIEDEKLESNDYILHPRRGIVEKSKPLYNIPGHFFKVANRLFNDGASKLNRVNFHTLRHTFATRVALHSNNPYLVKEFLDHSDTKISQRYVKRVNSEMNSIVNKI